jgi:tetratricopeptide (TPR) repeat protein
MQARELNSLSIAHRHVGDLGRARSMLEESIAISREIGNRTRLAVALANLGQVESAAGHFDRAAEALQEALTLDQEQGDLFGVAVDQHSLALVTLNAGRPEEARGLLSAMLGYVASSGNTALLENALELSAAITADLGHPLPAARLAGAAEALRQESGMQISDLEAGMLEQFLAPARLAVTSQAWAAETAAGRALSREDALTLLLSSASPAPG